MNDFYTIDNTIAQEIIKGLEVTKLKNTFGAECIFIRMEKGSEFPKHVSPKDANLLMLEGSISFYINQKEYLLKANQWFRFPKEESHHILAEQNSKFLIIR